MTGFYLALAAALAVSLTAAGRVWRSGGTLLAAMALAMLVLSIVLGNLDGTFAAILPGPSGWRVAVLNGQAAVGAMAVVALLWVAWTQARRRVTTALSLRNGDFVFGRVSRYLHWATAVLVLILAPMGFFTAVLPPSHPERSGFMATHQSLGVTVLVLVVLRMLWLRRSPPPAPVGQHGWERWAAHSAHVSLYALLLGFTLSGVLLTLGSGGSLDVFGWSVGMGTAPDPRLTAIAQALHGVVLPGAFALAFAAHLGAVLKHHLLDGRTEDLRRMLR